LTHYQQDLPHGHDLALVGAVVEDHTGKWGGNLHYCLVGLDFDHGLVDAHRSSHRDHPANDLGLGQPLTDVGEAELSCHQSSSVWRAALTIRSTPGRYWCSERFSGKTLSQPVTRRTGASSE